MSTPTHTPYRAIAGAYDALLALTGFKRGVQHFLSRLDLHFPPGSRLLDAGCGSGLVASYLARRFPASEIVAFDIDPSMLRSMQRQIARKGIRRAKLIIAQGDLRAPHRLHLPRSHESLIIPPEHFDGIFVSGALEHVPLAETVAKLVKLLKPGGIFFNLGVRRNPAGAVLAMVYRFRPYRLTEMRTACEEAGLDKIRVIKLSAEDFPANLSRIAVIAQKDIRGPLP